MIRTIAFDCDDTLWHSETLFALTQERFRDLLGGHAPADDIDAALLATESRNLRLFGYGVKGFTLSMVETAIELTDGRVTGREIQAILDLGRFMLDHPVELLPGVEDAIDRLRVDHRLMAITKGDLFNQESKIARSGLGDRFWRIEIVSEKDPETYRRVLDAHGVPPAEFLMVGNSVRSDVLPVVEIGGRAVHIPYAITWEHERVDETTDGPPFPVLDSMDGLPALVEALKSGG